MGRLKSAVIGFSGPIKSGKTTISHAVASALHLKWVSFGDFVRSAAVERGLDPESRLILQTLGESFIAKGWPSFCLDVLQTAGWNPGEPIVVDGIRHASAVAELTHLSKPLSFILVYVDIDEGVRRNRTKNLMSLDALETHSTERDVKDTLPRLADVVVDGNAPIDSIVEEIISFIPT